MKQITDETKFTLILVFAFACTLLCTGCRTAKTVNEHVTETVKADSITTRTVEHHAEADTLAVMERDTIDTRADERGTIEIRRDSTGRPVFIAWHRLWQLRTLGGSRLEGSRRVAGWTDTGHTSTAAAVERKSEATTQKQTEAGCALRLEQLIGLPLLLLAVGWLFYCLVIEPCLKRKK